ncbi:UNVERIFIED_CONTAM: hypothetical protein Slati_2519700 [Sesamum latifolium]|uniref:Uncharacterized protein n=1 Tax=Sesamum latifolium TaxID=2727402 RepID=A0AAW2WF10_9LAMI
MLSPVEGGTVFKGTASSTRSSGTSPQEEHKANSLAILEAPPHQAQGHQLDLRLYPKSQ